MNFFSSSRKSFLASLFDGIIKTFKEIDKENKHQIKAQQKAQKQTPKRTPKYKSKDDLYLYYQSIIASKTPLKTEEAIKIYRRYLKDEGDCDNQFEITDRVNDLKEFMKKESYGSNDDREYRNEVVREFQDEIKELKKQLQNCSPDEKECLIDEIDSLHGEIKDEELYYKKAKDELYKFRTDKSQFLIDYIKGSIYGFE